MRKALLILLSMLLLCTFATAADNQIDTMTQEITVNGDGEISLIVTVEVSFLTATKEFVFPLGTDADDVTASGASYEIETIGQVECVVFSDAVGFTGKRTFLCSYNLPAAVVKTGRGQQFKISLIEKGWAYPINALSMRIQFPTDIGAQPMWESAYYSDVIDNYLRVQIDPENTILAQTTTALKDHEQLSMTLEFPENTFTLYHQRGTAESIFSAAFYLLILAALVYWFFTLRGKLLLPNNRQAVGMEATAGELACQLYGTAPDLAATLAHWGNLGYLTIHRTRRGRILLQKQMDMGNERKPAERRLFDAIFRNDEVVDATTERFRIRVSNASIPMRQGWQRRIFAARSGSPVLLERIALLASLALNLMLFDLWMAEIGIRWLLIPILALLSSGLCLIFCRSIKELLRGRYVRAAAGAVSAILLLIFASNAGCSGTMFLNLLLQAFFALMTVFGGRRTEEGQELVRSLLGLRRFLRTAKTDALQAAIEADSQYFYRTLPFAELLGVGASFSKHCHSLPPEPCPWLTDAHQNPKNAMEFYHLYATVVSAIRADANNRLALLIDPQLQPRPTAASGRSRRPGR